MTDENVNQSDMLSQLALFNNASAMVHYYDKNGALRTGRILRRIKKGKRKGKYVVVDMDGKQCVPDQIRNIE